MKLLEIIIILLIITVFLSALSWSHSRQENMIKIETRRRFLQAAAYARTISILRGESIAYMILPRDDEIGRAYIDLRAGLGDEKTSLDYEWGDIDGEVEITDFDGTDEMQAFTFSWTGNSKGGTLEWKVGEDSERIIVNIRGRIYWQR